MRQRYVTVRRIFNQQELRRNGAGMKAIKKTEHRKNNRRGSHCWVSFVFVAFLTAFCYSAYKLTDGLLRAKEERNAFEELSAIVVTNVPSPGLSSFQNNVSVKDSDEAGITDVPFEDSSVPVPSENPGNVTPLPQYLPLYEMNPEFFGWLSIEGTDIDFPVMYSPARPEYYIDHAFDGSSSSSGVPFVDSSCSADGSYFLIYGHHMRNNSMFGTLPRYADQSYGEEHSVIRFDTLYEQREYQVVAAFYSRVYGKDDVGVFRYYEYTDLSNEEVFNEYMKQVYAAAIFDTGIEVTYGEELVVLSTCSYHIDDGRFVVVAKRVK